MEYVVVVAVLVVVVFVLSAPLRRRTTGGHEPHDDDSEIGELEAARDAKYREIRDAELDLRTGKLSDEDYGAIDQTLRAEAIEIMRELDEVSPALHEA